MKFTAITNNSESEEIVFKENDKMWTEFNKQLIKHAQEGDWGLYRNTRLDMTEFLNKESRLKESLITYLEICFLDLNGPTNGAGFKLDEAFLAPVIIERANKLIKELNLAKDEVKTIFFQHNKKVENSIKLPLSVEKAWKKIKTELNC